MTNWKTWQSGNNQILALPLHSQREIVLLLGLHGEYIVDVCCTTSSGT